MVSGHSVREGESLLAQPGCFTPARLWLAPPTIGRVEVAPFALYDKRETTAEGIHEVAGRGTFVRHGAPRSGTGSTPIGESTLQGGRGALASARSGCP